MSEEMNKTSITVSHYSGFCFGVNRALQIAEEALKKYKVIYSWGPIIHNPQVVEKFSKKNLKIIKDISELKEKKTVFLIPSHGIDPEIIKGKNLICFDTTCPLVKRVQNIMKGLVKKGYFIVIVGKRDHPEVKSLIGIAKDKCIVVKNKQEAEKINLCGRKVAIISQTTSSKSDFNECVDAIAGKNISGLEIFDTICRDTIDRQNAAIEIAKNVDVMFVIGGKNSSNTTLLARLCSQVNKKTHHIESEKELKQYMIMDVKSIGIATGASTPSYAIDEVIKKIRRMRR